MQTATLNRINHADLCFDGDLAMIDNSYRDFPISIFEEEPEEYLEPAPIDCFKCGGSPYCHHMDDFWHEYELAEKNATRHI